MQTNQQQSQASLALVQSVAAGLVANKQSGAVVHSHSDAPPRSLRHGAPGEVIEWAACAQHGKFPAAIAQADGRLGYVQFCPVCVKQAKAAAILGDASVPKSHQHCSFSSYKISCAEQQAAFDACLDYATRFDEHHAAGRCLLLLGNVGNGKNHLAASIMLRVLKHGYSALCVTAGEALQRYWGFQFAEKLDYIASLAALDLLVLDEIGRHSRGESAQQFFFDVIDARRKRMAPTMILSNLDAAGVQSVVTDAGMSRLRENGGIGVMFGWGDFRAGELS